MKATTIRWVQYIVVCLMLTAIVAFSLGPAIGSPLPLRMQVATTRCTRSGFC
jgi:hypothetical protein